MTDKVKLGVWDEFTGGYLPVDVERLLKGLGNMKYLRVDNNHKAGSKSKPLSAVDPDHYDFPGGVQVIDITKHLDFLTGNVVKYVCRAGRKGDRLTDLLKAKKYLDWAIEKEHGRE